MCHLLGPAYFALMYEKAVSGLRTAVCLALPPSSAFWLTLIVADIDDIVITLSCEVQIFVLQCQTCYL
eukprot:2015050-Pleurochrysis_carterae.AAC.1